MKRHDDMEEGEEQELPFLGGDEEDGPAIAAEPMRASRAKHRSAGFFQAVRGVSRRTVIIAAVAALLVVALALPSSRSHMSKMASSSTNTPQTLKAAKNNSVCSPARQNPDNIQAPLTPDIPRITAFWPALKDALQKHNPEFTLGHPSWQSTPPFQSEVEQRTNLLSHENATSIREKHAAFIKGIPAYPKDTFKGRGIVMLAGGHYSEYAATSLGVLRESGSNLPVEVWRRDEREEKHEWCDEIEAEGMACRRLSDYLDTDILEVKDGKEMKIFTMLFSSFEEIIFVDADNMPLQRPELLFESQQYKDTGALIWPDFWKYDNIDWLDYIIGKFNDRSPDLWSKRTAESGQLVWNKKSHWRGLLLATYYNYYGPDLYYTLLNYGFAGWGDKDTFPAALRALGEPYFFIPHPPENVWSADRVDDRRVGMLQMSPTSKSDVDKAMAMFLHATTIKWSHRDFLCTGCLPIWHTDNDYDPFTSRFENSIDELNGRLHGNQRLIDKGILEHVEADEDGLKADPEWKIWRAMEFASCRSKAWRHGRTCETGRRYMVETFGFTFTNEQGKKVEVTDGKVPGMEEEVCLADPPKVKAEMEEEEG
jgi:alpha 1,2-mannosyltransferase